MIISDQTKNTIRIKARFEGAESFETGYSFGHVVKNRI